MHDLFCSVFADSFAKFVQKSSKHLKEAFENQFVLAFSPKMTIVLLSAMFCYVQNRAQHKASLCGTHIRSSLLELTLLSVTEPVGASPMTHCQQRRLPRRAMNTSSRTMSEGCLRETPAAQTDHHKMTGRCFVLFGTTWAVIVNNGHNKSAKGTPILHAEASSISVETGLCGEIFSQTSLKHHSQFCFFLSL